MGKNNSVKISQSCGEIWITAITDSIINIFVPQKSGEHNSKAIEGEKEVALKKFSASENNGIYTIETACLKVVVGENFTVDFYRADGEKLMQTYRGKRTFKEGEFAELKAILEAEGHDVTGIGARNYDVQMIGCVDKGDDFYGLGDKPSFMNKKNYQYENWNSDDPKAHNEHYRKLYKSIPFFMCKKEKGSYGIFFDNTFHSYIDLAKENPDYFYYGADDGNLDYYFFGGDTLPDIVEEYTYLTGRTPLPQLWTLGYQQSRWSYENTGEVLEVCDKYRELGIPCDVIHLDIDYMDGFRVFTWDEKNYGKPGELTKRLKEQGYKTVTIIDPGTKADPDYFICKEGTEKGYFVTDPDGKIYVNAVWPGESNFPDFGREEVRSWWGDKHKILTDSGVDGIWNDMNEPSSFNGEIPGDIVFSDEDRKTTHDEMHNVYGHLMSRATYEGLKKNTGKRPFVITRACYSGTQKYSTVWTGDNQSLWSHLKLMVPQLCSLGISGFSFAGTDIGGFGEDTTPELLARWIEAACFSPLFRNHSAKGSRRQEPWNFGDEVVDIHRKYIKLRYRFLPYIYDLFYQGETTGLPVMRPLVLHYENDPETHNLNDEFLVGESLLVAPVLEQGATKKMVYLPEGNWFDYWTGEKISGKQYILRDAPLDVCPIYIKEGSLIPMYEEADYIGQKSYDTLYLLSVPGGGKCVHFQDNGEDFAYRDGEYNLYSFAHDGSGKLDTEMLHENYPKYKNIVLKELK
jgi:alpha-glucosidase